MLDVHGPQVSVNDQHLHVESPHCKAVTELPLDALSAVLFAAIVHEICGLHARRERWKDRLIFQLA